MFTFTGKEMKCCDFSDFSLLTKLENAGPRCESKRCALFPLVLTVIVALKHHYITISQKRSTPSGFTALILDVVFYSKKRQPG